MLIICIYFNFRYFCYLNTKHVHIILFQIMSSFTELSVVNLTWLRKKKTVKLTNRNSLAPIQLNTIICKHRNYHGSEARILSPMFRHAARRLYDYYRHHRWVNFTVISLRIHFCSVNKRIVFGEYVCTIE